MGQTVSSGGLSSIFWPTPVDEAKAVDPRRDESDDTPKPPPTNFNTFSCFSSRSGSISERSRSANKVDADNVRDAYSATNSKTKNRKGQENMLPTKKSYNVSAAKIPEHTADIEDRNSNHGLSKRTAQAEDSKEINGNAVVVEPGCSYDVAATRNVGNTNKNSSINRYMSALFNQGMKNLNLDDDSHEGGTGQEQLSNESSNKYSFKSKSLKRTYKQFKCKNSRETGVLKDTKSGCKLGSKKKNLLTAKFCCSKSNKTECGDLNDAAAAAGSSSSSSSIAEPDSGCVCTSYKKVDFNDRLDRAESSHALEFPRIQHNLTLGWASERAKIMNRNSSGGNWGTISGDSNIYTQTSKVSECVSCEGSHCHVDLNVLAEELGGLPINILPITVARVGSNNSNTGMTSRENNLILLSLGTQNGPMIDLSRLNPEDHPLEDCDERARVIRALEIAEGVEPPPGYNSSHMQLVRPEELRALFFPQQMPTPTPLSVQSVPQHARIHTQVDYIHCLVPDLCSITSCSFYWGKMDRYEAEKLLDGKEEGTFLLRDSAQEEHLFSVSFRKYQRSLHARIEQFNHKFSFDSHDPGVFTSDTVTGLIEHYKDPSCVMFFEPMLTSPLSRTFTFSLQHLCRAVIASCTTYDGINQLRLPNSLKAYLKEYHYRQRVRVKRFDESPDMPEETV